MQNDMLLKKAEEYLSLEVDPFFRKDLEDVILMKDFDELNDRFYTDLAFGTGGLRGVIGGGYNRINPFVVRRATQGLANYVKKTGTDDKISAVIAFDSRNFSDLFAKEAALVFCGNGITTYLFSSLRPTPELSFAVRRLKASIGLVVTASHNPAEYNGYKVYWSDGAQIVPPHDSGIIEEVRGVTENISVITEKAALEGGLLKIIDSEIDVPYMESVKSKSIRPSLLRERGSDLKVVYTPLHGTGTMLVEKVLGEMGIDVITVPEQREPDGDFPTVDFPNPEIAPAMKLSLELAEKVKADVVMGTDPDADRLGIAVPDAGGYRLISGNQLGALLCDYIFSSLSKTGRLPVKPVFVKTIVTTDFQKLIAADYGAECFDVLTGFKYIAEKIRQFESGDRNYVFGGEESYGYLVGTDVRDKDAVSAAFLTAEMTLFHLSEGKTLIDRLNELYFRYGYFEEFLISEYFKGESGLEIMNGIMKGLRESPPETFGGQKISYIKDFLDGTVNDKIKGTKDRAIDLPSSNVLQFIIEDRSTLTVRPSGTEPKIKFYASVRSEPGKSYVDAEKIAGDKIKAIRSDVGRLLKGI